MNINKKIINPLPIILITSLLCFFYFSVLHDTWIFSAPRLSVVDTLFKLRTKHAAPRKNVNEVVVVGIDDESYAKMNRAWPWGREIFAIFLEHLEAFKPKVIGLDFSFIGRSVNEEVDQWFASALSKGQNVVLSSYFSPKGRYMVPLENFSKAASAVGFVDKTIDADSFSRKVRAIIPLRTGQEPAFSFATEVVCRYLGISNSKNVRGEGSSLLFKDARVPTDPDGYFWLSYRYRAEDFKYISFWKIIANQVSAEELQDKIVVVGLVSDLSHDIHDTPIGRLPGIFMNANEIVALLDLDFLREAFGPYYPFFVWAVMLAAVLVFYYTNFFVKMLMLISSEVLIYAVSAQLFIYRNLLLEPFSPMLMIGFAFVLVLSYEGLSAYIENVALQKMVIMDSLTGLYGYGYMNARLDREFEACVKSNEEFCFVMIDIDNFKQVNDRYGHEQGNALLIMVASSLKSGVRSKDAVARYGGDELALILKTKEKEALLCLERIKSSIENLVLPTPKGDLTATISAGICSNKNPKVKTKNDLIHFADEALYQAKSQGRNKVCAFPS